MPHAIDHNELKECFSENGFLFRSDEQQRTKADALRMKYKRLHIEAIDVQSAAIEIMQQRNLNNSSLNDQSLKVSLFFNS